MNSYNLKRSMGIAEMDPTRKSRPLLILMRSVMINVNLNMAALHFLIITLALARNVIFTMEEHTQKEME